MHLGTLKILSPSLIFKQYFVIFWISFMTGPNKVHAFLFVLTEERIIGGNFYWETFWMRNKLTDWSGTILFATLNSSSILIDNKYEIRTWKLLLISTYLVRESEHWSMSQIMINKLTWRKIKGLFLYSLLHLFTKTNQIQKNVWFWLHNALHIPPTKVL